MQHNRIPCPPKSPAAKEKYWRTHLAAQTRSGFTLAEYCRRNHLSKSTFGWWKSRLKEKGSTPITLVPVSISHQTSAPVKRQETSSGLSLIARDGCRIEIGVGFHSLTLEQVLRTLERL